MPRSSHPGATPQLDVDAGEAGDSAASSAYAAPPVPSDPILAIRNQSLADQVANAADTYLTGSLLEVPDGLSAGDRLRWIIAMTKTAAGIIAPTYSIRVGLAGTIADTARITFSGAAQTAAVDTGRLEIEGVVRSVSASGVIFASMTGHNNTATGNTGFAFGPAMVRQAASSAFDNRALGLKLGLSVNPGASGVWTVQLVTAELLRNLS